MALDDQVHDVLKMIFNYFMVLGISFGMAMFIALATANFSLYATLRGQLKNIQHAIDALNAREDSDHFMQLAKKERDDISARLDSRLKDKTGYDIRHFLHTVLLASSFFIAFLVANSHLQLFCLMVIFSVLLFAASVDIDHRVIPEKTIFVLGLVLAWATLSQSVASWTTPVNVLLGLGLTATIVSVSWLVVWMHKSRRGFILFGDGDMIVLIALALYFGVDTLLILAGACLTFILICWKAKKFEKWMRYCGQYPEREHKDEEQMPFMPAIYVGTIMMVVAQKYISIGTMIESLYHRLVA